MIIIADAKVGIQLFSERRLLFLALNHCKALPLAIGVRGSLVGSCLFALGALFLIGLVRPTNGLTPAQGCH